LTNAANSLAAYLVVPKPVTITYTVREDNEPNRRKMMNPGDDPGLGVRVLSPIELGILEDIGYTVK
jgi:hypothetical protein